LFAPGLRKMGGFPGGVHAAWAAMVSRGEVGLIIAAVGLSAGLVSDAVFASIVGMVIVTTLITPPMLRSLFETKKETP
jgi:Kef-type K+ transport system membrane component KefB